MSSFPSLFLGTPNSLSTSQTFSGTQTQKAFVTEDLLGSLEKARKMTSTGIATKRTAKILAFAALLGASAYGLLGSAVGLAQSPAIPPHVALPISIDSVMVALVDQAAHEIWEGGNQDRDLTDREWLLIEQHALQLAAAGSVISLGGTGPADRGWMLSPAWQDWSSKLGTVALEVKQAVDAKSKVALRDASDKLVDTCESCHRIFKPDVPSEGIMHQPHYPSVALR